MSYTIDPSRVQTIKESILVQCFLKEKNHRIRIDIRWSYLAL